MRKNNNKDNVRTITTGHIEGDMLGQVYLWLSERTNRRIPQRPHRTYQRVRQPESKVRVCFRATIEWFQTAPTALLRKFQYANKYGRRLAGVMRRNKRNGK